MDALEYIHSKGVAHRDIKLENIFLGDNVEIKIADFGLMKIFEGEGAAEALRTRCGTESYMSPELLKDSNESYNGPANDIFAAGVMLFMMISAK